VIYVWQKDSFEKLKQIQSEPNQGAAYRGKKIPIFFCTFVGAFYTESEGKM